MGSEFVLDWQTKHLEAKFGASHQFDGDNSAKFKLNHHGYLDFVLRHRLSSLATLGIIGAYNLKAAVVDPKTTKLPFGLSLDLHF